LDAELNDSRDTIIVEAGFMLNAVAKGVVEVI